MACNAPCLKCLLVGDMDVGKTELLISYTHDTFPQGDLPVFVVVPPVNLVVDGCPITFSLDDTSGQEEDFQSRRLSYAIADVVIVCYSVVSRRSFDSISRKWAPELRAECPDVPLVLTGTNLDQRDALYRRSAFDEITSRNIVTTEQGLSLAKAINARYFIECSSTTQYNVFYLFYESARLARLHWARTSAAQQREASPCSINDFMTLSCCCPFSPGGALHSWLYEEKRKDSIVI